MLRERLIPQAALAFTTLFASGCGAGAKEAVTKISDALREDGRRTPITAPALENPHIIQLVIPYGSVETPDTAIAVVNEANAPELNFNFQVKSEPKLQFRKKDGVAFVVNNRAPAEEGSETQLIKTWSFNLSELSADAGIVSNARLFFTHKSTPDENGNYNGQLEIPAGGEISVNNEFDGGNCYDFMPIAKGVPGGGACQATSMLRQVAAEGGLTVKPIIPMGQKDTHDPLIGGVKNEYQTTVWCTAHKPEEKDPDREKDLMIINSSQNPIVIKWQVAGDNINFSVKGNSEIQMAENPVAQNISEKSSAFNTSDLTPEEMRYTEAVTAEQLDSLLPQTIKDGGFCGEDLVRIAKQYNVNPGVLWTFAWEDSWWGAYPTAYAGQSGNVIGISDDSGPRMDLTVEQSVEIAARSMDNHLNNVSSFAEFAAIWAPPGAANDYNSTNAGWPQNVIKTYWEKIGPLRGGGGLDYQPALNQAYASWALENMGRSIQRLPETCPNCVALTYDTEYGAENKLPEILRILDAEQVKATFFILGDWGQNHQDWLQEITRRGHLLANHGQSHPYYSLTPNRVADITGGEETIFEAVGQKPLPLFRLPYGDGSSNSAVLADLGLSGYVPVGWSVDTNDWKGLSANEIAASIGSAKSGDIILMHPQATHTAEALQAGIQQLKMKGLTPVRLDLNIPSIGPIPLSSDNTINGYLAYAEGQLGKPYIWGAEGEFQYSGDPDNNETQGYDCSGLIYAALLTAFPEVKDMPRVCGDQVYLLPAVIPGARQLGAGEAPKKGDLAFFNDGTGYMHHCAIIKEIDPQGYPIYIEASGEKGVVRITSANPSSSDYYRDDLNNPSLIRLPD